MTSPVQPERDIVTALDHLASRWRANNCQPIVDWTPDVKMALHAAAAECYEIRASSYPSQRGHGEWLYDLTWISRNPAGRLVELVLACECEWSTTKHKIDEDFQKLLTARATVRLMVFEQGTRNALANTFRDLRAQITASRHSQRGDRYLLSGFDFGRFSFTHKRVILP